MLDSPQSKVILVSLNPTLEIDSKFVFFSKLMHNNPECNYIKRLTI